MNEMNHLNIKMGAGKTTKKFELNFQKDISKQIKDIKIDQLMRFFVAILNILSISFLLMNEYGNEFIQLFKSLGKALAEGMKTLVLLTWRKHQNILRIHFIFWTQ